MWGIIDYQYTSTDTTNLQLIYSLVETGENIEFEEKAISVAYHSCVHIMIPTMWEPRS